MAWYHWDGQDLLLHLRIQPKASKDEFVAPYGDEYKVRITAPPTDGKANSHLCRYLAKAFGVTQNKVALEAGKSSRSKRIRIQSPTKAPIPIEKA